MHRQRQLSKVLHARARTVGRPGPHTGGAKGRAPGTAARVLCTAALCLLHHCRTRTIRLGLTFTVARGASSRLRLSCPASVRCACWFTCALH